MSYELKLDHEAANALVLAVLKDDVENLKADRAKVLMGTSGLVFSRDREEDLVRLDAMIVGYNRVLAYYGEQTSC